MEAQKGLLSIVMVCYNHEPYINESIESVISQTYKNWELVIVDDGSQDNSLAVSSDYAKKYPERIKFYTHPDKKNLGISASYQLGLSVCQGEFVGFLEPDDIWSDTNAELKINSFLSYNVDLVFSGLKIIGEPEAINKRRFASRVFFIPPVNLCFDALPYLFTTNFIPSFSCVIVRKRALQDVKFISNRKYAVWLDWFLWIQVGLRSKFFFIPEKLVSWRLYRDSFNYKFILRQSDIKKVKFEIGYRLIILSELILFSRLIILKKFGLFFLFVAGAIKRIFIYLDKSMNPGKYAVN